MPNSISPNSATITGRQGAGALRAILPAAHKAANPTVYENMTASRQAIADHGTRARESYDNPTYTGAHNNWARQDTTATTTACVKMRGARRLPLRIGVLFCETMTFLFILDQAGWTAADCHRWACGMVAGAPRASSPMPCLVSGYLSATIGGAAGKHCRSPEGTQAGGLADHDSGPPAWAGVYGAGWHQAVTLCWLPLPAWAALFVLRCDDCVTSDADTCSGIVWPHGSPGGVRRFGRTAARYPAIAQPYGGYPSVVRPGNHTAPRLSTRQRHKMDTVRQPSSTTKPAVADGFITTVPPAGLEPASPKAMDFKSTASTNSAKGATVLC